MATYTIGPAATYATWTAFRAALPTKPAAGDIVEWQASSPGGSLTVTEIIDVPNAGTSPSRITLRGRSGDTVIVDGQDTRTNLIRCTVNFITFDNLQWKSWTGLSNSSGMGLNGGTDIIVQNCTWVVPVANPGSNDRRGLTALNGCHRLQILTCNGSVENGTYGPGETDVLLIGTGNPAASTDDVVVRGCTFTMANQTTNVSGHNDAFQTVNCKNLLVEQCFISRPVTTTGGQGQACYLEWYNFGGDTTPTDYGTFTFRNNVCYGRGAVYLWQQFVRNDPPGHTYTKDAIVANIIQGNVFDSLNYSGALGLRFGHNATWAGGSLIFQDNIVCVRLSSGTIKAIEISSPFTGGNLTCDYNHYYAPSAPDSSEFTYNGTSYTYAGFRTAVGATHGLGYSAGWSNPNFTDQPNGVYTLSSTSPDIGIGVDLSATFTTDIAGTTRSAPWTIGAYAYAAGVAPTLVSATVNAAGTLVTFIWSASCMNGAGAYAGMTMSASGGAVSLTGPSGSGSATYTWIPDRTINFGEAITVSYAQPGNGIEATSGGADVASFTGISATNSSTQGISIIVHTTKLKGGGF